MSVPKPSQSGGGMRARHSAKELRVFPSPMSSASMTAGRSRAQRQKISWCGLRRVRTSTSNAGSSGWSSKCPKFFSAASAAAADSSVHSSSPSESADMEAPSSSSSGHSVAATLRSEAGACGGAAGRGACGRDQGASGSSSSSSASCGGGGEKSSALGLKLAAPAPWRDSCNVASATRGGDAANASARRGGESETTSATAALEPASGASTRRTACGLPADTARAAFAGGDACSGNALDTRLLLRNIAWSMAVGPPPLEERRGP